MTASTNDPAAVLRAKDGVVRVLALDHRDSMQVMLPPETSDADIVALKADLVGAAAAAGCSGVMLDPHWGMSQEVLDAAPSSMTVIAALEAQGYLAEADVTHTTLLDGWDAAMAVERGAGVVKILSLWDGTPCAAQDAVIADAAAQARALGVPLVSEPLPRGGLDVSGEWVVDWVAHAAETGLGDILKVPFPGSAAACAAVSRTSRMPWVLLSAGVGFEEFIEQTRLGLAAGAAGYIVGRSVWREAATLDPTARATAIDQFVGPRLEVLRSLGGAQGGT